MDLRTEKNKITTDKRKRMPRCQFNE